MDAKAKRIHTDEMIITGNTVKKYTTLQLYDQNVQYVVQNNTCTRSKLPAWNNRNCIPDNATMGSPYRLGLNQSLMVTDYSYTLDTEQVVITVTNDMCVPVVEQIYGQVQGASLISAFGVEGVTTGIKDPSVFNIPDVCQKDRLVEVHMTKRSVPFVR